MLGRQQYLLPLQVHVPPSRLGMSLPEEAIGLLNGVAGR
jgi:hypothetical protein